MREMDFSEKNLRNRWLGVKGMWALLQGETRRFVKRRLERVMRAEVSQRVGCGRYERSRDRRGHRNGHYVRDLLTSYGWIEGLQVPRVRQGGFQPSCLQRYRRRQRAVERVLLAAFLLGHATRKVRRLCRSLFGAEISAQTVSNVVTELDGSESASWWWGFVSDLKQRGLGGRHLEVIVSDGAPGLVKAIQGLCPRVKHQLCTFHKAMDLGAHLVHKRHRHRLIADALDIFRAATPTETRRRLRHFTTRWTETELKAVRALLQGFDHCLVYLDYLDPIRTRVKTTNPIERHLEEIRRRIIPTRAFNNTTSVERIIYGIIAYVLKQPPDKPTYEFTRNP